MNFESTTALLFFSCADRPTLSETEASEVQAAHLQFQFELAKSGAVITAGPFSDQSDTALRGMTFLNVSPSEALELYANDPAVKRGLMYVVSMLWHRESGTATFQSQSPPENIGS
jgi:uncharacterized protein YciI